MADELVKRMETVRPPADKHQLAEIGAKRHHHFRESSPVLAKLRHSRLQ